MFSDSFQKFHHSLSDCVNSLINWYMQAFNPLMHNVPKWSDTLLKSCSKCCLKSVPDHFGILCIKRLTSILHSTFQYLISTPYDDFPFCWYSRLYRVAKFWNRKICLMSKASPGETVTWSCSIKKLLLKISQISRNLQKKTCFWVSFLIKLQTWGL